MVVRGWCGGYVVVVWWLCDGCVVVVLPALACDVGVEGGVVEGVGGDHGQGDVCVLQGEERGER